MDMIAKMLEAMVITLREGLEAALVVGILLAYLRKTGRERLVRHVVFGVTAAASASVAGAVLMQRYGVDPENEVLEGSVMLAAAALVASLVIWMSRTGRSMRRRLETRVEALAADDATSTGRRRAAFGVFAFAFLMVLREGVETVLFLTAISETIGASPLYNALGGGVGLLMAVVFGVLLAQGGARINLHRFFVVTGAVLSILVGKLVAGGLHEFFEVGLLPSSPPLLSLIGLLTRESTSMLVLILLIALPGLSLAWDGWWMAPPPLGAEVPAPERRRELAGFRRARLRTLAAGVAALAISLVLGSFIVAQAARGYDPAPVTVTPEKGAIRLAVPADHKIHKYVVDVDGVAVRFFLLKRTNGRLSAAFDVCFICPAKGYVQNGDHVVCKNCDAPINVASIGLTGGCNPIPLTVASDGGGVTVTMADLAKGRGRFANR